MISQTQWIQRLRQIIKTRDGSNWSLGDALSEGETAFGRKPAYDIAQKAIRCHRCSLYRIARVAAHYPARLRFDGLSWSVFVALSSFPLDFLNKFLPSITDSDLSAKLLRERACSEYGGDPTGRKQTKFCTVRIKADLRTKIVERSGSAKITALVTEILESWLLGEKCERQPASGNKTREWNQKVKDAGEQHSGSIKDTVGAVRNDGKPTDDVVARPEEPAPTETPRSSYSERREEQIDGGAKKIPHKTAKKYALKVSWTKCREGEYLDTENGPAILRKAFESPAAKFYSEADALAAADEHFKYCGYHERVEYCDVHSCWHVCHNFSRAVIVDGVERHVSA
jgi:hypothetical protein